MSCSVWEIYPIGLIWVEWICKGSHRIGELRAQLTAFICYRTQFNAPSAPSAAANDMYICSLSKDVMPESRSVPPQIDKERV